MLVTDYLEGVRFDEVKKLGDAERDSYGEMVFRFFFDRERTLMVLGDPHPGQLPAARRWAGRVSRLRDGPARPGRALGRERALGKAIADRDAPACTS